MKNTTRTGICIMVLSALCFSLSDIGVKVLGDNLSAWQIVAGRGLMGMLVILAAVRFRAGVFMVRQWPTQLMLGTASALGFTFFIMSIKYLPLSVSLPLSYLYPAVAACLSPLINKEKASRTDWLAIALALMGVICFSRSTAGGEGGDFFRGIVFGLIGAFFIGLMVTMARRQTRSLPLSINLFYLYLGNALICLPLVIIFDQPVVPASADLMKLFFFIAPISVVGFLFMFLGYRYISAYRGGTILMLEAAAAAVYGLAVLGEPLTFPIILGGLLLLTSAVIISRSN